MGAMMLECCFPDAAPWRFATDPPLMSSTLCGSVLRWTTSGQGVYLW